MKKLFFSSGIVAILLLAMLLTGLGGEDDAIKAAIRKGNKEYESGNYPSALNMYEAGLELYPDSEALNANAAHTAYMLGEYGKAIEYYAGAGDGIEKSLNIGNILYWAGSATVDTAQKMQLYEQAMQVYMEGIIQFPQNVPLKYNYELLNGEIKAIQDEMKQEGESQSADQDEDQNADQDEDQSADQDESQGGDQGEDQDEAQSEDQEEAQSEAQEENAEQGEDSGADESEGEDSGADEGDTDEGDTDDTDDGDEQMDSYSQAEIEGETDLDAIAKILQMLELQEEQSLKNNQEVVGGNAGNGGW